MFISVPEATI